MVMDLETAARRAREMEEASVFGRARREFWRSARGQALAQASAAVELPPSLMRAAERAFAAAKPLLPLLRRT